MIDVWIRGPLGKKEYTRLKKVLEKAGTHFREKKSLRIEYTGKVVLEKTDDVIVLHGENGGILKTHLTFKKFSEAARMLHSLGFSRGMMLEHNILEAKYGGVHITLMYLGKNAYYYEAGLSVKDPPAKKEAEGKLLALAKEYRLPIWSEEEVTLSHGKVNKPELYPFDYAIDGSSLDR